MSTNQNLDANKMNLNDLTKYFSKHIADIDSDKILADDANKQKKKDTKNICPSCKKSNIIEDFSQGILVCKDCGDVIDNILDYRPARKNINCDDE